MKNRVQCMSGVFLYSFLFFLKQRQQCTVAPVAEFVKPGKVCRHFFFSTELWHHLDCILYLNIFSPNNNNKILNFGLPATLDFWITVADNGS